MAKTKTKYVLFGLLAMFMSWVFATQCIDSRIATWYFMASVFSGVGGFLIVLITLVGEYHDQQK